MNGRSIVVVEGQKEEIMEASYSVLCREGYSGLSIQNIADELGRGKSYIYHYYSSKEDLMVSFLEYILGEMDSASQDYSDLSSEEKLGAMIDEALKLDEERKQFKKAVLEMQAKTPFKQEYAEKFRKIDKLMIEEFTKALKENDVEKPRQEAEILVSTIEGLTKRKTGYNNEKNMEKLKNRLKNRYIKK